MGLLCSRARVLASVLALALTPQAWAQHRHDQGHSAYSGWVNQKDEVCCSGHDCGFVEDVEERQNGDRIELFVGFFGEEKKWCPVLDHHFTKKGAKSPDWAKSHACVLHPVSGGDQCSRLKCVMLRPSL